MARWVTNHHSGLTVKDSTSLNLVYSMNMESRDLCITISPHWLISKWNNMGKKLFTGKVPNWFAIRVWCFSHLFYFPATKHNASLCVLMPGTPNFYTENCHRKCDADIYSSPLILLKIISSMLLQPQMLMGLIQKPQWDDSIGFHFDKGS